jgi:hypothetical protein
MPCEGDEGNAADVDTVRWLKSIDEDRRHAAGLKHELVRTMSAFSLALRDAHP